MKKLIRAAICLLLIFVCGTAWAVEYTLPEKMNRQLEIGSGLKGSFVLQGEGSGPMTDAMRAFFDAEIQVMKTMLAGDNLVKDATGVDIREFAARKAKEAAQKPAEDSAPAARAEEELPPTKDGIKLTLGGH